MVCSHLCEPQKACTAQGHNQTSKNLSDSCARLLKASEGLFSVNGKSYNSRWRMKSETKSPVVLCFELYHCFSRPIWTISILTVGCVRIEMPVPILPIIQAVNFKSYTLASPGFEGHLETSHQESYACDSLNHHNRTTAFLLLFLYSEKQNTSTSLSLILRF